MDEAKSVTVDDLAAARELFFSERANVVAKNAVSSVGLRAAARVPEGVAANSLDFDIDLTQGKRCNQQRSGRQGGNRHGRGNRPQKNNDGNA